MLTRVISGAVMVAILIPCILFSHTIVLDIFVSLLLFVATYEMLSCIGYKKVYALSFPVYIIALLLPFCIRVFNIGMDFSSLVLVIFVLLLFYTLSYAVFSHGKHSVNNISILFTMIFYITFGFSSIIAIRNLNNGQYLFLLIFISAWISDTGAYFVGVLFGKHKLIPDVSPKKTVEGAIGGLSCCIASFLIFSFILEKFFNCDPNYVLFAVLGLILSVISMCGDLIASLVKRNYDLKDYGNLIPGHGGIMDRFDSIIATSSILFVLLNIPFIVQNLL